MKWMENLGIFEHRTAEGTTRRLRKELEEEEWARFIGKRLKWGVAPGPDGVSSDLIKTMSRTEKEVLRVWVNQILTTGDKPREITDEIRNGTIALLHKGSDTTELFTGLETDSATEHSKSTCRPHHRKQASTHLGGERNSGAWASGL